MDTRGTRQLRLAGALAAAALTALFLSATAGAATQTFTNSTPIAIPDLGQGTPYPSAIQVSGLTGALTDVNASVATLNQRCVEDLDLLLVAPGGQRSILLSDSGSQRAACLRGAGASADITFDDGAPQTYPCQVPNQSGAFKPTDDACGADADDFTPVGPAGPYPVSLAEFNGADPNGTWNLFALDDTATEDGSIAGWSLQLTTAGQAAGAGSGQAAGKCFGHRATILGTSGPDQLAGTPGRDVILGLRGKDTIRALGAGDVVCGGRGDDTLRGGGGPDILIGGANADRLIGGGGGDRLFGGTPGAPPDKAKDRCAGGGGSNRKHNCEL